MRNIKLIIEYDGTDYAGWQRQKLKIKNLRHKAWRIRQEFWRKKSKIKTVQETIEEALQKILSKKIHLIASGRTDAGVHAKAQVANFKTNTSLSCDSVKKALNAKLPHDITILQACDVDLNFHSRFCAKAKTYRYTILNRPYRSSLDIRFSYHLPYQLNVGLMKAEAQSLLGKHNFKSFQSKDKVEKQAMRSIKRLDIKKRDDFLYIDIEADGFLYNMVRTIIGTLVEIGRGKLAKGSIKKILKAKNRNMAGPNVPAKGLCLVAVKY